MTISAKPILMNSPMVQATQREIENPGTGKTQTRRFMKIMGHKTITEFGPSDTEGYDWHFRDREMRWHDYRHDDLMKRSPYQVGQLRWVRETWFDGSRFADFGPRCYRADPGCELAAPFTWIPSIHMPRWASRITLEVTDVVPQRIQDISEADVWAEGIVDTDAYEDALLSSEPVDVKQCFSNLWTSINGPESWNRNDWVWAVSFKPYLINVDQFIKERAAA